MKNIKSKILTLAIVVVVAIGAYAIGAGKLFIPETAQASPVLYNADTVSSIYNNANPAVVEIDIAQTSSGFFGNSLQEGLGSGIVVDNNGYIVTNNHVVDSATSVRVNLQNGKNVSATVIGTDSIHDLAVIKVDASAVAGITPLQFADSNAVVPGQMAIAIGNPYGLDDTVTVGIVSGLNRSIGNLTGVIQTDAAINPGNSGGPLLDANGLVIGINTAIETGTTGNAVGIGFAVPSNVVVKELSNLESGKTIAKPWIGISGIALSDALSTQLNLSVNQGVYVISVTDNSPAANAGLKGGNSDSSGNPTAGGDVITAIDGNAVTGVPDISTYINNSKNVGDTVQLTVLRDGAVITVQVTLGTWPSNLTSGRTIPTPIPNYPWRHNPNSPSE
jgi:S1-C subfamily serine protease